MMTRAEESAGKAWPMIGASYKDADGRRLTVLHVEPGEPAGREVRGVICVPPCGDTYDHRVHPNYSTTMQLWEQIWHG